MDRHLARCVHGSLNSSGSICQDCEIVQQAASDLAEHFHFRRHLAGIVIDSQSGELHVSGNLPSYYLKQLLQTVLREVPGVKRINNQVAVVASTGLGGSP